MMILKLQLAATLLLVLVALSFRMQWLPFKAFASAFAFILMCSLVMFVIAIGYLVTGISIGKVLAVIVGIPLALLTFLLFFKGISVPAIHDITTDWVNPPLFQQAQHLRTKHDNSLIYDVSLIEKQRQAYPGIESLLVPMSVNDSYDLATDVALQLGWQIHFENQEGKIFEAVDSTQLLGFHDDIVVRISEEDSMSRIDIRSASRLGLSDLGANAKRIERFISKFKQFAYSNHQN